jgi:glycosyltransferase involved in cell wall biosynthesis
LNFSSIQFLNSNHSWGLVGQALIKEFIKKGHNPSLISTNGSDKLPEFFKPYLEYSCNNQKDLFEYLKSKQQNQYQFQLSYTAPINFGANLSRGNKNRFGIWNYETTVLPVGFAKYHNAVDYLLPSSEFSKQIFLDGKIPEEKLKVVPHGVDKNDYINKNKLTLPVKNSFKILLNIAQPHLRKNIKGSLEAYGKAFTKKDNVVLICKVAKPKDQQKFNIDFNETLKIFKKKYPNHAEIFIMDYFIPNMVELYNSIDLVYSLNHAECFYLPGLESFAADKLSMTSRYGGQLDYMNDENSFLVDGNIVNAPLNAQYWDASPKAKWFDPDLNKASEMLKDIYKNHESYLNKFKPNMEQTVEKYSWTNAANQILSLIS